MMGTAPNRTRYRTGRPRWQQPRALLGLGLLAFGYWGTVALFNVERPLPRRCQSTGMERMYRLERMTPERSFNPRRHPRSHGLLPGDRLWAEPAWAPHARPRPIGLAYDAAPVLPLFLYRAP